MPFLTWRALWEANKYIRRRTTRWIEISTVLDRLAGCIRSDWRCFCSGPCNATVRTQRIRTDDFTACIIGFGDLLNKIISSCVLKHHLHDIQFTSVCVCEMRFSWNMATVWMVVVPPLLLLYECSDRNFIPFLLTFQNRKHSYSILMC